MNFAVWCLYIFGCFKTLSGKDIYIEYFFEICFVNFYCHRYINHRCLHFCLCVKINHVKLYRRPTIERWFPIQCSSHFLVFKFYDEDIYNIYIIVQFVLVTTNSKTSLHRKRNSWHALCIKCASDIPYELSHGVLLVEHISWLWSPKKRRAPEGILMGLGNPLLDITTIVDQAFLER